MLGTIAWGDLLELQQWGTHQWQKWAKKWLLLLCGRQRTTDKVRRCCNYSRLTWYVCFKIYQQLVGTVGRYWPTADERHLPPTYEEILFVHSLGISVARWLHRLQCHWQRLVRLPFECHLLRLMQIHPSKWHTTAKMSTFAEKGMHGQWFAPRTWQLVYYSAMPLPLSITHNCWWWTLPNETRSLNKLNVLAFWTLYRLVNHLKTGQHYTILYHINSWKEVHGACNVFPCFVVCTFDANRTGKRTCAVWWTRLWSKTRLNRLLTKHKCQLYCSKGTMRTTMQIRSSISLYG